jgi:hypothetical protein
VNHAAIPGGLISGYYLNVGAWENVPTWLDVHIGVREMSFGFAAVGLIRVQAFSPSKDLIFDGTFTGAEGFIDPAGFTIPAGHAELGGIGQIARVRVTAETNHGMMIDNVHYRPVPEPGQMFGWMLGFAIVWLIFRKRWA